TSVTVTFDEEVLLTSVSGSALQIGGTCGPGVTASVTSTASGTSMEFELLGVSCTDGQTLIVTFDGSDITDEAGNIGSLIVSETYTVDASGPSIVAATPVSGTVSSIPASVTFTFSEDVDPLTVNVYDDFAFAGSCSPPPTKTL